MTTAKQAIKLGGNYWRLWTASVVSNLGDGVAQIAYVWLASAVTRNAVLLAGVAVVQRLPWLVFSLPAGVITDRVDRRKLILGMHGAAFAITAVVAAAVLAGESDLPTAEAIESGVFDTGPAWLLGMLYVASILFGFAEVLRDNASQTILPAIVEPDGLEKANGRLWSAEMVANSFVGPPLGGFLLGLGFAAPFIFDAGTFALAAGLVFLLTGTFQVKQPTTGAKVQWRAEIMEGLRWLWRHPVLRPLAITLGALNGLGMIGFATFVFFAQEVLEVSALTFGILLTGAAFGGVTGGLIADRVTKAMGRGPALYTTLLLGPATALVIGSVSLWPVIWAMFFVMMTFATVWNVITVSLRQTVIPDQLLGRVNSVYRFFGWGAIPVGTFVGGVVVAVTETFASREMALRVPWWLTAALYVPVVVYALPRLTSAKLEAARAEGLARREAAQAAIAEAGVEGAPPPPDEPPL